MAVVALVVTLFQTIDERRADFANLPEFAEAKRQGKPVAIEGEKTANEEVWANPDGTLRRDISSVPKRVWVRDGWRDIDLDLAAGKDGLVRPKASTGREVLSGGGDAPLLKTRFGDTVVTTSWPSDLPKPDLSGPVATYADVLPGVDLKMTVTGGNKARVFESAFGFNRSNADDLIAQLRQGVMEQTPTPGVVDKFGSRFTVDIPVAGPSGSGTVRTGWIYDSGSITPRLTTAFPR